MDVVVFLDVLTKLDEIIVVGEAYGAAVLA